MDADESHSIYEFEGFRLDTRRRELTEGAGPKSIPLKPMQYETLVYFVERPGKLIDKHTLMDALWPDAVVEENNLNQHITALRRLLGEERGGRRFIMNVRGRGYRFVPEVMRLDQKRTPLRSTDPSTRPPTNNMAAWQCFQQAIFRSGLHDPAQWAIGVELLQQAVKLDPEFASAYALLAAERMRLITVDWPDPRAQIDRAAQDATRAIGLRPDLAFPQMSAGSVAGARGNWVEAEECFRKAELLDEDWPFVRTMHIAFVLVSAGRVRRARELSRATEAQPHGMIGVEIAHAVVYLMANEDARTRERLDLIVAMGGPPHLGQLAKLFSHAAQREGRHDDAIRLMKLNLASAMRGTGVEAVVERVFGAIATGAGADAAVDLIDGLLDKVPLARLPHYLRFHILEWYAQLGAMERSFAFGHTLIDLLAEQGTVGMTWVSPWLREMREFRLDPRFGAFASRLGLPAYWERYGPPA